MGRIEAGRVAVALPWTSPPNTIFVFGSNLAGVHGAGAALQARRYWGAIAGRGTGRGGMSYAIPTKDGLIKSLPLAEIDRHVTIFLEYARAHPDLHFYVTRVGCGLAGYDDADIAPLFAEAPGNCDLPEGWRGRNDEQPTCETLE